MKKLILFFSFILNSFLFSQETPKVDTLDCVCSVSNNLLKGITSFTVLVPNRSSASEVFIKELEKVGVVKQFSLSDPKGVDFEGMGTGARLLFHSNPQPILGENKSSVIRTSLLLSVSVEILKTKHRGDSYIWATNLFSTVNEQEKAVKRAAWQFISDYKEAQPEEKPLFFVYH
jgi:hypothetical protein